MNGFIRLLVTTVILDTAHDSYSCPTLFLHFLRHFLFLIVVIIIIIKVVLFSSDILRLSYEDCIALLMQTTVCRVS